MEGKSLRERLWGKVKPIAERLATVAQSVGEAASGRAVVNTIGRAVENRFGKSEDERLAEDKRLEDAEVKGQIELNDRMGFTSDALGNTTGRKPDPAKKEPKVVQIQSTKEHAAEQLPESVPAEWRTVISETAAENGLTPKQLAAQLLSEGLTSTSGQLAEAEKREGAVGVGQHRPIFIDEWGGKFEQRYGHPYNPRDQRDNIRMTAFSMGILADKLGSWEAALIAYNKGESVTEEYKQDKNLTFDDDPYVKGVKGKLDVRPAMSAEDDGMTDDPEKRPLTMDDLEDLPGETLSKYRFSLKQSVGNVLDKVKGKVNFLDTNFEKAVREEIAKTYPLTPEAKAKLNKINIKDRIDPKKYGFLIKEGASALYIANDRGEKFNKVLDKLHENPITGTLLQKMPERMYKNLMGENMSLDDANAKVAFHESLHGLFGGQNINPDKFLQDWNDSTLQSSNAEVYGDVHDLMQWIGENMGSSELYKGIDKYNLANEYFAYLGQYAGIYGIDAIPPSLQKYYKGILESVKGDEPAHRAAQAPKVPPTASVVKRALSKQP